MRSTDKQTDRHTDHNTLVHSYGRRSNSIENSTLTLDDLACYGIGLGEGPLLGTLQLELQFADLTDIDTMSSACRRLLLITHCMPTIVAGLGFSCLRFSV